MFHFSQINRIFFILGVLLFVAQGVYAGDPPPKNDETKNEGQSIILHRHKHTNKPTDIPSPDTIEATIIGDDLHIGLEEQTGKCNVTVTNSITGSSFQTTVSSANPVVYNVGTSDAPLVITVETSDNISYEGVMMPE